MSLESCLELLFGGYKDDPPVCKCSHLGAQGGFVRFGNALVRPSFGLALKGKFAWSKNDYNSARNFGENTVTTPNCENTLGRSAIPKPVSRQRSGHPSGQTQSKRQHFLEVHEHAQGIAAARSQPETARGLRSSA